MPSFALAEDSNDVASRVLRRARVSKMTRALQDRLTLANIKILRGWQHRSLESLEPELEQELKRKRTASNADLYSDSSSIVSGHGYSSALPTSSPLTSHILSDEALRSGSSQGSAKRLKRNPHSRRATRSSFSGQQTHLANASWHAARQTTSSSTAKQVLGKMNRNSADLSVGPRTSITLGSPSVSEDDDQDIPVHSFQLTEQNFSSSPPRTPPPDVARSAHLRSRSFQLTDSDKNNPGREGADLLLYLASSPSPAMRVDKTPMLPPSTPPAKQTPLPSSMMTPGGHLGFGPYTPNAGFNFADFVNVTPSPAQGPWSKTPSQLKTPVVTKDTRRRLNFESLTASLVSPRIGAVGANGPSRKSEGLGMELGGELRSHGGTLSH